MSRTAIRLAASVVVLTAASALAQPIYVNAEAPPGGDGHSWPTAFADLTDALAVPGAKEVWVAAGTYLPDRGTGDRMLSFNLQERISLYGGFAGFEDDLSQRDIQANPTILSGDLNGDDQPGFANRDDNAKHVVEAHGWDIAVDGFVIRGGSAGGPDWSPGGGGGIRSIGTDLKLANCIITDNSAPEGGGVLAVNGSAYVRVCQFVGNRATSPDGDAAGGAAALNTAYIIRCRFQGNIATAAHNAAGGALKAEASVTWILNSLFIENACYGDRARGGAVFAKQGHVFGANVLLLGNRAVGATSADGGAIVFASPNAMTLDLCCSTVGWNYAEAAGSAVGGGLVINGHPAQVSSSIFWANEANGVSDEEAQVAVLGKTPVDIGYCDIQGCTGALGGAGNFGSDPLFVDVFGPDGQLATGDEDLALAPYSPCIDAGDVKEVLFDQFDLDGNGKSGQLSIDLAEQARLVDDPSVSDTGLYWVPPAVDLGAFERQEPSCYADCDSSTGAKVLDIFDYLCFIGHFAALDPAADCNADGSLDLFDFLCFTNAFNAGC